MAPHLWVFLAHSSMSTKTVYYESMAILIRGKTREIHSWYLFPKTKIQKTQVENGHTPTFLNSNSIQNFVDMLPWMSDNLFISSVYFYVHSNWLYKNWRKNSKKYSNYRTSRNCTDSLKLEGVAIFGNLKSLIKRRKS